MLLAAGGLLLASFVRVMQVERGFEPASVVAVDLNLPGSRYDPGRRTQLYDGLLARLTTAPVVASVGIRNVCLSRGQFGLGARQESWGFPLGVLNEH